MATQEEIRAALEAAGINPDEAPTPSRPAPDPSQGRGGNNQPADFRTADHADFAAELAKYNLRPRSNS